MLKLRGDNLGNYSTWENPKIGQKNTSEDLEKFYSYFEKLNARKRQNEEYVPTRSEALVPLDYEISEQETVTIIDLYPTLWSRGLIIPIFKKDDPSNRENYRGITLISAMGKIFTSIMNSRLNVASEKNMVHRTVSSF